MQQQVAEQAAMRQPNTERNRQDTYGSRLNEDLARRFGTGQDVPPTDSLFSDVMGYGENRTGGMNAPNILLAENDNASYDGVGQVSREMGDGWGRVITDAHTPVKGSARQQLNEAAGISYEDSLQNAQQLGQTAADNTTKAARPFVEMGRDAATTGLLASTIGFLGMVWGRVTNKAAEGIGFTRPQLQHAFKHAEDFGVAGNANNKTLSQFSSALQVHVDAAGTRAIQGTYRGNPVTHFVDSNTGLNVIRDSSGNFLSGWKLSPEQLQNVMTRGKL